MDEHLRELLLDRGFEVGQIDPTIFTKRVKGEIFLCQLRSEERRVGKECRL